MDIDLQTKVTMAYILGIYLLPEGSDSLTGQFSRDLLSGKRLDEAFYAAGSPIPLKKDTIPLYLLRILIPNFDELIAQTSGTTLILNAVKWYKQGLPIEASTK
jgi:hypothetical protein